MLGVGKLSHAQSIVWAVPILAEAAALARSLAFAWMLGPDELGQAMILALTVRLAEMASDLGVDRLMVQARDGGGHCFQAQMHGVAVARGIVAAFVMIVAAPALAAVFAEGPDVASYMWLALIPLLRGGAHLDLRRCERLFRYRPMAMVEGGATLVMAIGILPAALWLADHRAMVLVLILHAATYACLSHLVASRPYRVGFSRAAVQRVWRFGAPLVANAALLFLTFYADRIMVASAYDWATLAVYGVALQLALLPAQIIGRAAASLVLPRLRIAIQRGRLHATWQPVLTLHVLFAVILAAGFTLIAPAAIALVYGPAFQPDTALSLALGVAAGFRILRTPYSQLAIATGRTGDPARANLLRAVALIPAGAIAFWGYPLAALAAFAACGEAAASLYAVLLARAPLAHSEHKEVYA